jgi:hypothetical protein
VAELETQNLDAKLEIDSLKASSVVSDEVECAGCPIFLADLAMFMEKHASKCEELDVLRVEVVELKSRPALLRACTSCPVLHGKIDEMHAYIVSLESKGLFGLQPHLALPPTPPPRNSDFRGGRNVRRERVAISTVLWRVTAGDQTTPKLKEPVPTPCSTCELHALKNLELAHYVDHLQDENDELKK